MRLAELLGSSDGIPPDASLVEVTSLSADSRAVTPGALFAAIPGTRADGGAFIAAAEAKGAVAAIASLNAAVPPSVAIPVIRVADPRVTLSAIAARFYPRQPDIIVAVTGTSGKTSVAEFTRQIFASCKRPSASLGTIGVIKPSGAVYGSLTTPDPITLHRTLSDLASEGVTHLAMEASSHGLDQHRLDGVRLTAAAFTNLGRDHMDYHASVAEYFSAKMRLFKELLPDGATAVVNVDGAACEDVLAVVRARGLPILTAGARPDAKLALVSHMIEGFTQRLEITYEGRSHSVVLPLIGAYQVENAMTAAGLAIAAGEDPAAVIGALPDLKGVKGRLDIAGRARGGLAVVDYAHKPEALSAALAGCRPFVSGRLICVFGCGGDRDKGKRPIMGAIAADNADVVIVTDDNPRSEEPSAIRAEILAAAPGATEIGDRAEAIQAALAMMVAGDVVLVAGKGHETGQIVGDTVLPFSDHAVIEEALSRA